MLKNVYTHLKYQALRIVPDSFPENVKSTLNTTHSEYGGHDTFRYGTRSIKNEVLPKHPLESRLHQVKQRYKKVEGILISSIFQWEETQWELKLNLARQAYGMHAPIKLMMERSIVEKVVELNSCTSYI